MLGQTIGHYRLTDKLGAGGMGEVFRAQDVRLGRAVSIKFLPDGAGMNPAALERFQREARAASALNHPNICTIYELGEHRGQPYIVMEFLEGMTVEKWIHGQPISTERLLDAAIQVTEALAAAHAKGIIHRDIKPSNLFLTEAGLVKVLDFGLAKLTESELSKDGGSSNPTREKDLLTSPGAAVGTVAYMSPEQALGQELDARTDVFSLGVVLYEMATGRKPFSGATTVAVFDSILHKDPTAPVRLNPDVPRRLEDIIDKALEKDAKLRYQSVSDLGADLKRLRRDGASQGRPDSLTPPERKRFLRTSWAVTMFTSTLALWALLRPASSPPRAVTRFTHELSEGQRPFFSDLDDPVLALSPDGESIVHLGGGTLYRRPMNQVESTAIRGTEGAETVFFSPDGQWIGFYGDGTVKKVPSDGGAPVSLCAAPLAWGASWSDDDTILFAPTNTSGLSRISASGGSPAVVTTPDTSQGEISHRWPEFLPGGTAALFTIWKGGFDNSQIALLSLETGKHRVLLEGGSNARLSPTGHIIYAVPGKLMAAPFDPERLELLGEAVPVLENVATKDETGAGQFSLSGNGGLAYLPSVAPERTVMWVDRQGRSRPLLAAHRGYSHPRLSPDGRRLALMIHDGIKLQLWLYDLEREALSLYGSGVRGSFPVWTQDGKKITFQSGRDIVWQAVDGSGTAETLIRDTGIAPTSWSRDGDVLAFSEFEADTLFDIWILSLQDANPRPFLQTDAPELSGAFSPDGRWLAYVVREDAMRVYIQPFPGPGPRHPVSTEGGTHPVWARSGREIFYRSGDKLMAVAVETEPELRLSKPTPLFEEPFLLDGEGVYGTGQYDVAPDGEHFVMIEDEPLSAEIQVVLNWSEELKQALPPGRR